VAAEAVAGRFPRSVVAEHLLGGNLCGCGSSSIVAARQQRIATGADTTSGNGAQRGEAFFDQDGGLHAFGETRYDYRLCHSIKIDVKFKPATKTDDEPMREDDIIVEISKPYLQYPFYD
jgi:hypothetical protein